MRFRRIFARAANCILASKNLNVSEEIAEKVVKEPINPMEIKRIKCVEDVERFDSYPMIDPPRRHPRELMINVAIGK
jgi:hypothetical protein